MKFKTLDEAIKAYDELNAKFESQAGDLSAAQSLAEEAEKAKVDAEAKLKTSTEAQTKAEEQLKAETERADGLAKKVETLKAEAKSAEARAAEICAAAGVDPIETDPGNSSEGSLLEKYNAIKDPKEKGEFLQKHQAALYKESARSK